MTSYTELKDEDLPKDYTPDWQLLERADQEGLFMEASFNLLIQSNHWAILATNIQPVTPMDRNHAIIIGSLVKLVKLQSIILRDMSKGEYFQQLSISRQFIETVGTLEYLLADDTGGDRYDQFVMNGLIAERELLSLILSNQEKSGNKQHIETRMIWSIENTAKAGGIDDVSKIPSRKQIKFPSAEERVKQLGPNAYGAYRAASAEVHSDWGDLYKHHLNFDGTTFTPDFSEPRPRPQIINTMTILMCKSLDDCLDKYPDPRISDTFKTAMNDIAEKTFHVIDLHEKYLARR